MKKLKQPYQLRGWNPIRVQPDGVLYTTCSVCNRLLRISDGPRCQECQVRIDARKRMQRRQRKLWKLGVEMGRHRPTSSPSESDPGTESKDSHPALSKVTATPQGPDGSARSRQANAAFGGQVTPQRRIPR